MFSQKELSLFGFEINEKLRRDAFFVLSFIACTLTLNDRVQAECNIKRVNIANFVVSVFARDKKANSCATSAFFVAGDDDR